MMKNILLFLLFATIISCSRKDFLLLDATRQSWTAGPAGKGTGTLYEFMIQVKTDSKLEFETVWIGNEMLKVKTLRSLTEQNFPVGKNDTLILSGTIYTGGPMKQNEEDQPQKSKSDSVKITPPVHHGLALIIYKKDSELKYIEVDSIKTMPKIIMP